MKKQTGVLFAALVILISMPLFSLSAPCPATEKKQEEKKEAKNEVKKEVKKEVKNEVKKDEKQPDIYRLYKKGKLVEALKGADEALTKSPNNKDLQQLKYNILMDMNKLPEALAFVEKKMNETGETGELLSAKHNILLRQGKLKAALDVALKKEKTAKTKTPWDCIMIMHVYLRMENKEDALDWLQEAVSRGFISFRMLEGNQYKLLVKSQRFYQIIETIKVSIGLGRPAREIEIRPMSDPTQYMTLRQFRGKVVLVNFWATWCGPCTEEINFLNAVYKELHEKGFEIIGICLDSSKSKAKEFVQENNIKWPVVCTGDVWQDKTVKRYGINEIPSHWLIDKNGVLRSFGLVGPELHRAIVQLMSEK